MTHTATLAYRVLGTGQLPVLCLHPFGASGTGRFWEPALESLDLAGLRVILPDLPGHGDSAAPAPTVTMAGMADLVAGVLAREGATRCLVVGHSIGGRLALRLAVDAPERVGALLLFEPAPPLALPLPDALVDALLAGVNDPAAGMALLTSQMKAAPSTATAALFFGDVARASREGLAAVLDTCRRDPFADALPSIAVPTVVVAGMADPGFPPPVLRATIQQAVPGARLAVLDVGHYLPLEAPTVAAALIAAMVPALAPGHA